MKRKNNYSSGALVKLLFIPNSYFLFEFFLIISILLTEMLVQAQPASLPCPPEKYLVASYDPVLVGIPPFRRQFLDAMVVEESNNLQRVFHAAEKYEGNPIFVKEKPWEGWGPSMWRFCGEGWRQTANVLLHHYF